MGKTALLFGSIGVLAETSDIQRRAYNQALSEAGLAWRWDEETYRELLKQSGGKERLAHLAGATGQTLSQAVIDEIHHRKTELACAEVVQTPVKLRPGVAELAQFAKQRGMKLGFVTSTYQPNIDAILRAARPELAADQFDVIISRDDVPHGKPAPDAYIAALTALGIDAHDGLAIEDTAASLLAAKRAGLEVVATPGAFTSGQDFWQADLVLPSLLGPNGLDPRLLSRLS